LLFVGIGCRLDGGTTGGKAGPYPAD
jgi:hypothetical protein